jgi:hypothetical protein
VGSRTSAFGVNVPPAPPSLQRTVVPDEANASSITIGSPAQPVSSAPADTSGAGLTSTGTVSAARHPVASTVPS